MKMSGMFTVAALAAALLVGTNAMAAEQMGADRHVAAGVKCEVCHGPDLKNPQEPTLETCTGCHNLEALVAKTKNVKPHSPHESPHYQDKLDCINCHYMHSKTEDFCGQCHQFNFKVP